MSRIAIIPGDGIGAEVMEGVYPLLQWAKDRGRDLEWVSFPYGADHWLRTGEALSEEQFLELRDTFDAILFGAVGDPRIPDGRHAERLLLKLRQDLRLRVNFRPCAPLVDAHVPLKGVPADMIRIDVFRENTEGPYCLKGHSEEAWAVDESVHTIEAVQSLLRAAFEHAQSRHCPLILAHKANVLKHGHGLWMRVFTELRPHYPQVNATGMHADALLCALVQDPRKFGVIAADNFIGDLVSDLLAGFQGGMGVAPSASWAPDKPYRCSELFEPVHGSAPDIAGKGIANPIGMTLSTALFFQRAGWESEANLLKQAVKTTMIENIMTPDLGGSSRSSDVQRHIEGLLLGINSCA